MIGERIKKRRDELGLSLRELADVINMTAGYLSRVENNQVSPSLDALQAIAQALQVPMFYFLNSGPVDPIIRAGARRVLYFPDSKIGYELLTPDLVHQMMSMMIRIAPGVKRIAAPLAKPNEQWMYVLEGSLKIDIDGKIYILYPGDSIYYDGNLLRDFSSVGQVELILICCIIPPIL
jgi:transcriptional regulator with XRE-family HTH domain